MYLAVNRVCTIYRCLNLQTAESRNRAKFEGYHMLRFGVGVLNLRSHVVMNEAQATNAVIAEELEKVEETLPEKESEYVNCVTFGGSQRPLLSACGASMMLLLFPVPQRCGGLAPIMVEALLFLKENGDCWGMSRR